MQFLHDILRERLLYKAGIFAPLKQITMADLEKEVDKVWCIDFFTKMRNRLLMGYLRYGKKSPNASKYNYINAIKSKLLIYEQTGNTEMMVDIGNYAMLEFKFPNHPDAHFSATDDTAHAKQI